MPAKSTENPLSDFNDLHALAGINAVRDQLDAALANYCQAVPPVEPIDHYPSSECPPHYADDPGADADDSATNSPDPSERARLSLEECVRRFVLLSEGGVWDADKHRILKKMAFKDLLGKELYDQWLNHDQRRTADKADVLRKAPKPDAGGRGLMAALIRYVYLNPSDMAWDKDQRELVPLKELKYAIADCFEDWIKHPMRNEILRKNLVFDPSQTCSPKTHINTFRGFAIEPHRDDSRCVNIVNALWNLCNQDETVFKWLCRWLAYPLQNPGAKMASAVLVHSAVHGSGKSYFFDVVMRAIYGEYAKTVGQAQLEGQYNDWMSRTLYACYEEVLSRGQKYSHTGTLKQIITGTTVRIEKKFTSGWEESNHMNSVFLSNEVLPLPVEPSDRRFCVIWPEAKMYQELQVGVDADLQNGGAAAFYGFLLDVRMQDDGDAYPFGPHTQPPMTAAKQKLIAHGLPIWEVFFKAWQDGEVKHCGKDVPFQAVRVGDLFKIFDKWCSTNKEHGMGAHKFASFIETKVKKRRDLDYAFGGKEGKATFFMIGEPQNGVSQKHWLGGCVDEFDRLLHSGDDYNP
jgi:putative DNA primase/helicase